MMWSIKRYGKYWDYDYWEDASTRVAACPLYAINNFYLPEINVDMGSLIVYEEKCRQALLRSNYG